MTNNHVKCSIYFWVNKLKLDASSWIEILFLFLQKTMKIFLFNISYVGKTKSEMLLLVMMFHEIEWHVNLPNELYANTISSWLKRIFQKQFQVN